MPFRFLAVAIAALFSVTFTSKSYAGAVEGKKVFEAKKCSACHITQGPAREKTIHDQLAKKGPVLWYAGSKFQRSFLEKWLKDPKPIRGMEYNSLTKKNTGGHPRLDGPQAAVVTDYLMTLKSPDVKQAGIKPDDNARGRVLFEKKQSCYGCHKIRSGSTTVGGLIGPTMVNAGERLQPDWIYSYFSNRKAFLGVSQMPDYTGFFTDSEIRSLAAYIASMR